MTSTFLIGTIGDGLRKDMKPFATPEDSFEVLTNMYQWRGRLVRRQGYTLLGRLANNTPVMGLRTRELFQDGQQDLIAFDTTQAYKWNGTTFISLPSVMPVIWSGTDYQFFYSINYAGAFWATNSKAGLNGFAISSVVPGSGITTITTTLANGFVNGQTVTLVNLGGNNPPQVNNLNGNTYVISNVVGNSFDISVVATGTYTPNGIALNSSVAVTGQDGIRYYGQLTNGSGWANYNPPVDTNNVLMGALLMFAYRGYLVFLNTTEGNDQNASGYNYGGRARWVQIGTPYYSEPVPQSPNPQTVDPLAARDDLFGRGGAFDAPTQEVIIAAAFIRDILIVYFERSTWRLRFVNNAQNPFVWERVNVELGANCQYSAIPFDKGLMAIGNRGIVISDGNDTNRFDEKIPDDIFNIRQNNNGFQRVFGIRTFRSKLNYWTYPSNSNPEGIFPDQVLVFNYETKNWSYFDDTFTCFGYYYQSQAQICQTWNELINPWTTYGSENCNTGTASQGFETIIAGNQQGFVLQLEQSSGKNSESLYISNISVSTVTSPIYNLPDGTWITITGTGLNSTDGVSIDGRNFKISNIANNDNDFIISEYDAFATNIPAGASYSTVVFSPMLPDVQINVGSLVFTDPNYNGILKGSDGTSTGTIDYNTGALTLSFVPSLGAPTMAYIRVISFDTRQQISVVTLTGSAMTGLIAKISGINVESKIFNFFKQNQKARLSRIDFYTNITQGGSFTCDVLADSSDVAINVPLSDNLLSNIVQTSQNPYAIASNDSQNIYRLYADSVAQTLQLNMYLQDQQLASDACNSTNLEILAMMVNMRPGGRIQ